MRVSEKNLVNGRSIKAEYVFLVKYYGKPFEGSTMSKLIHKTVKDILLLLDVKMKHNQI